MADNILKYLVLILTLPIESAWGSRQLDDTARHCLYLNAYFEARAEPVMAHQAIIEVVLSRVESTKYPNSVCGVIFQKNAFSWTRSRTLTVAEREVYEVVKIVVDGILDGFEQERLKKITYGSTHYHQVDIQPCWLGDMKYITTIGSHVFYKQQKRTGACYNRNVE